MKKYCILAAVLVLTLSVFTGCGCRKREPDMMPTDNATLMPTEATSIPTTDSTEGATSMPATDATGEGSAPTGGQDMIPDGMDPDNNTASTDNAIEGRTRSRSAGGN